MTGFYIIQVFTERCFRTDYGAGFSKISLFFKKNKIILIPLKISHYLLG